jgi:hypothetical protein
MRRHGRAGVAEPCGRRSPSVQTRTATTTRPRARDAYWVRSSASTRSAAGPPPRRQRAPGGGEVQADARVLLQPGLHRRVLVSGVVVAHHVQLHAGMGGSDLLQEPHELLVPVMWVAGVSGDAPGGHLQRREQRGGGVALVVMGLAGGQPRPQRQHRLGPLRRKTVIGQRRHHHVDLIDHRRPPRPRLVLQRPDPARRIPLPPADHRRPRHPGCAGDLRVRHPIRGQQHNPCPLRQPRRHARPAGQRARACSRVSGVSGACQARSR